MNGINTMKNNTKILPFIIGKTITLRHLVPEDIEGNYPNWFNDADICVGNSHHVYTFTKDTALEYIRSLSERRDIIVLAIIDKSDEQHVGNISLQKINYISRSAELAIIIGEKSTWGKGIGKEAAYLMAYHGFMSLNLNRIECGTFENNIAMLRIALFLGMKHEGTRRGAVYKEGQYLNVLEYGVLKSEFDFDLIKEYKT